MKTEIKITLVGRDCEWAGMALKEMIKKQVNMHLEFCKDTAHKYAYLESVKIQNKGGK